MKTKLKKVLCSILTVIMLLSTMPMNVFADLYDESTFTFGYDTWESNGGTCDTHWARDSSGHRYPLFCVAHGDTSPSGTFNPPKNYKDPIYEKAAAYIYLGYTSKYGDTYWADVSDRNNAKWAFEQTQYIVWSIVSGGTDNSSKLDWSFYGSLDALYNRYYDSSRPSFNDTTQDFVLGETKTISDYNGLIQYYPEFTKNIDGVEFKHTNGSNDIVVTVTKECKTSSVSFYSLAQKVKMLAPNGANYDIATDNWLFFNFKAQGLQNLIHSYHFDPKDFIFNIAIINGAVEVFKNDNYGSVVNGAKFGIYSDFECTNMIQEGTISSGSVKFDGLAPAKYYIKEISAPDGYLLDKNVYSITVNGGETTSINIANSEPIGRINIKKVDVHGEPIEGARFRIKSAEKITAKNGKTVLYEKDTNIQTLTTDSNGNATSRDIPLGKYTLEEISVPAPYLINTDKKTVTLSYKNQSESVIYGNVDYTDKEPTGTITINKKDNFEKGISGVKYKITAAKDIIAGNGKTIYYHKGDTVSDNIITDSKGQAEVINLHLGSYNVTEVSVPAPYILGSETTKLVEINYKDQTTSVIYGTTNYINDEETGEIEVIKTDIKTGNEDRVDGMSHHGDATLDGTVYTLYANKELKAGNGINVYYKKGAEIATFTFNEYGKATISIVNQPECEINKGKVSVRNGKLTNLPLGEYLLKETEVPEGYKKDKTEHIITLSYKNQNTKTVSVSKTVENDVKREPFEIIKISDNDNQLADTLEGAEFTVILKRYVDFYGSFDEAMKHMSSYADDEHCVLVTDEKGYALSDRLAYGTYVVHETKVPGDGIYAPSADFEVLLDNESETPTKVWKVANDVHFKAYIKMIKKDVDSEENVTYSNATFSLYRYDDETKEWSPIRCKVGNKYFYTWTTDENGIARTETELKYGTYKISEVKTPKGFLGTSDFTFYVNNNNPTKEQDKDGDMWITVTVNNKQPKGELTITKDYEKPNTEEGVTYIASDFDYSDVVYEIKADEDIIDYTDGEIKYKKGQTVGTYSPDLNGKITVPDMWMGKYTIQEIETSPGYVLDDTVYNFEFAQKDLTTRVYKHNFDFDNYLTKYEFSKSNINGEPVIGAELSLYEVDSDGNQTILDSWTSSEEPHIVKGIPVGTNCVLVENKAPDGYVIAKSVEFTVENSTDSKIDMVDKRVGAIKVNVDNIALEGAELSVINNYTQQIVDSWISDGYIHYISNLVEGESYTLVENKAPDGYVIAKPIEFDVTFDKETQVFVMTDKQYTISKVDIGGEEVEGAELKVIDKETNEVVDEWTSTTEPHFVNNLEEGKEYILHEEVAPDGYVVSTDVEFTVSEEKVNEHYDLIDKRVSIDKVDVDGNILPGARLQIIDPETGEIIDEWITPNEDVIEESTDVESTTEEITEEITDENSNPEVIAISEESTEETTEEVTDVEEETNIHYARGLVEGKTYILREAEVPEGYVKAKDIEIEVTLDKETQEYVMTDKQYTISKVDIGGEEVEGAELKVIDKETNEVVDEWTSTTEPHFVNNLEEGKEYILHEEVAPDGYVVSTDVEFTVSEEKVNEHYDLIDKRVSIDKVDVNGNILPGAKLQIIDPDVNEIIDEWTSTTETHYTSGLAEGKTYILREAEVPEGYVKAKDIEIEVTLDKETQKYVMTDKQVVISKVDATDNKELEGAELEIVDNETKETIDKWTSEKEPHIVSGLKEGGSYTLTETTAPYGYEMSESVVFTVTDEKNIQKVVMKDAPILSTVRVEKIDSMTKQHITSKKFEFSIYSDSECKELLRTSNANEENGTALFDDLRYGEYYIKETKAPTGYQLSNQVVKIQINDKGVFADNVSLEENDGVYSFEYMNTLLPIITTGETEGNSIWKLVAFCGMFVLFVVIFIIILIKKKKK